MDFFTSNDWLNRPGPTYAFKLDHILFIVISMLIGVGLCLLLRKKEQKTIKIVLISLWAFAVAIELFYYGYVWIGAAIDPVNKPFNIRYDLPFHSCLMFLYVFPFAIFSKNKLVRVSASNFLVVINMIIGFITLFVGCPPVGKSVFSLSGLQSMILHVIIVIVPLIMVATNCYDLQIKDLKYGLALFGILGIVMWTFDLIAHCDYFYFFDGTTFPVLKTISENVPPIVWTLIVVFCYAFTGACIHFLICAIKFWLVPKLKEKKNSEQQPQ